MIAIRCVVAKTGAMFDKAFDDARKARAFVLRCEHGDRIAILSIAGCESDEEMRYVSGEFV